MASQIEHNSAKYDPKLADNNHYVSNGMTQWDAAQKFNASRQQKFGLKQKATALAVALGTLPVFVIGVAFHHVARQSLISEISDRQIERISELEDTINAFMGERYQDMQGLAALPILNNPSQAEALTSAEKQAILNSYLDNQNLYDSIAVFDLNGNIVLQSRGDASDSPKQQAYFQAAIDTNQTVISKPQVSPASGQLSVYIAAPVKAATGKPIAIVRSRLPLSSLSGVLAQLTAEEDDYYLIDSETDTIILTPDESKQAQSLTEVYEGLAQLQAAAEPGSSVTTDPGEQQRELLAYAPLEPQPELPNLNWGAAIGTPTPIAFAPLQRLLILFVVATGLMILLVGAIAAYIAQRAMRPILAATAAVDKLGQGELDARVLIDSQDELAVLGVNINRMASRLQTLLQRSEIEIEQAKLFGDIANSRARTEADLELVFNQTVTGARAILAADRMVIYRFYPDWRGYICAESVTSQWPSALGKVIEDPCISQDILESYRKGRVVATNNVWEAGFHPEHLQLMERLKIQSNLVTPILKDNQLFGLLIAHHCQAPHTWQQTEIDFLKELAIRVGLSLDRVNFLTQKDAETERAKRLHEVTCRIQEAIEVAQIYDAAITGSRDALKTDRAIVYLFDENWQGKVVAESVDRHWPQALGANIADPCFAEHYVEKYRLGRVTFNNNIYESRLDPCYLSQLEPFEVKANLVAPIVAYNRLHGLLVTHQCDQPRQWQESEITFFKQVATQVGLALDRRSFLEQLEQERRLAESISQEQRQQKEEQQRQRESIQQSLLGLLDSVQGAAGGDLTVRADVTGGEIGTVADFFNSIIESLRQIVTRVKQSAFEVSAAISDNESAIAKLSAEAMQQAEETMRTLNLVSQMTASIEAVVERARQASEVANTASRTAQTGQEAMDLTVHNIVMLRDTIGETAKKVKLLGESSQGISRIISLIDKIALKTNLLAVNASIEAAHAGESGQGFAVVAEEIGELAIQSTSATQEIEKIIANIQQGTTEVVEAMEESTTQVVEGTHLVEGAKQSLSEMLTVSAEIDQLVEAISEATLSQMQMSAEVSHLMNDIAQLSERTSNSSYQVSGSLQQTIAVARELQESVSTFKVDSELNP